MVPSPKIIRVFLDTEFTAFINTDLISIGVKAETGEEFYGENAEFIYAWSSDWVKENIYPLLDLPKLGLPRKELSARLWSWIEELPVDGVIITVDYAGDWRLLDDLFEEDKHPKIVGWELINEIIFKTVDQQITDTNDVNAYQNQVSRVIKDFSDEFDQYFLKTGETQHHALSDARANARAWNHIVINHGMPL